MVGGDTLALGNRRSILEFAAKHKLPTMYSSPEFVEEGGLLYDCDYGADEKLAA